MGHFSENNMLHASEEFPSSDLFLEMVTRLLSPGLPRKDLVWNNATQSNKAQSQYRHKDIRTPPPPAENNLQTSDWIWKRFDQSFFQGSGKQFIFLYRTGCEKSFLAEFLFHNQNNSREVKWLFFWDFFPSLSLSPGQSRRRKRERKKKI
jgi:hypothetical protein